MVKVQIKSEDVKKRRRVSKKTKKSWRKHVDTKDIDKFLEDQRLEERLGAPFAKRPDEDLFAIDTKPSKVITDSSTKQAIRKRLKTAEPKCYALLKPLTAVPDPISKRNRVKTPEERKNPITRRIEAVRKASGYQTKTAKLAAVNRKLATAKREFRPKRGEFNVDIWQEKPEGLPKIDPEWLSSDTMRHTLAHKGIRKRKVPVSLFKKPSIVPAVDVPHPGTSYNPSYEDHQDLLRQVAENEQKLIKEEAHLDRVTRKMFQKVSAQKREQDWLKESSEGLPTGVKEEISDDEGDLIVKSVNPPVKNIKKTRQQRRKQKEQKKLAFERKLGKIEKRKIGDLYKLRFLQKNLRKAELKAKMLQKKREKLKALKAKEPKVLSKTKFEAPEPDFKMSEELAPNLRCSAPTGNLLKDRYKSLQLRNIVAPGIRVMKVNKAKVKKFIKPDHKIERIPKNKSK